MTNPTTSQPVTFRPRAHAESEAAAPGRELLGMEAAMANRVTADYLLARGYRTDSFIALLMLGESFGRFENCVLTDSSFSAQMGSV
jgi:hypothetical protein